MIKDELNTDLADAGLLDEETTQRLAALSVTTPEELFGLISAQPEQAQELLGTEINELQASLARESDVVSMASMDEAIEMTQAFGAEVPPELADQLPTEIDLEYLEREIFAVGPPPPDTPSRVEVDLRDCMSKDIRHQGDRPTCVAHAVCAQIECLRNRDSDAQLDLSEQFSYCSAKKRDPNPEGDGTFIRFALESAVRDGICPEDDWNYNPKPMANNQGQGPASAEAVSAAAGLTIQGSLSRPDQGSMAVRRGLDAGQPVAVSVLTFENWKNNPALNTLGVLSIPLPGPADRGHAMCAVGYGSHPKMAGGGYLILRNSWGKEFAPRGWPGHMLVPFLYFDKFGIERYEVTL